jgi:hypothetical protein
MKIVFYLPAILFTAFYGLAAMSIGISSISPIAFVWITLFIVAGALLRKGKFFGGFIGIIPGIHFIYMSTKDTGQVMDIEMPMGVIILIFYMLCSAGVIFKKAKNRF